MLPTAALAPAPAVFAALHCAPLATIDADLRRVVAAIGSERIFSHGDYLGDRGRPVGGLHIVLDGEVRIARAAVHRTTRAFDVRGPGGLIGGRDLLQEPSTVLALQACGRTRTLFFPRALLAQLASAAPAFVDVVRRHELLTARVASFYDALRRCSRLRQASPSVLDDLFAEAELVEVATDERIVEQGQPHGGLWVLLEGTVRSHLSDGEKDIRLDQRDAGDVFGDHSLFARAGADLKERCTRVAVVPCLLAHVPRAGVERVLGCTGAAYDAATLSATDDPRGARVHVLQGEPAGALSALTDLLARTLSGEPYADRVLVVRLDAAGATPAPVSRDGLDELCVRDVDDLLAALRIHGGRYDLAFVDPGVDPRAVAAQLARAIDRVVHLSGDGLDADPVPELRGKPVGRAVLLGGAGAVRASPAYPSGSVRLRLDERALAAMTTPESRRLTALKDEARASVGRLARAITQRRVGVALGGGGAWGFAHVPLLRALAKAGVPVDLVSGASFGSIVGGYYCGDVVDGLDTLMKHRADLGKAMLRSVALTTHPVRDLLDRDLRGRRLEELEIPLFPVAADAETGAEIIATTGTIGTAVCASGAFPFVFPPGACEGRPCVDGGIVENVPENVLVAEDAHLIVASNIVSVQSMPPAGRRAGTLMPRIPRVSDLMQSMFRLVHIAGDRSLQYPDVIFEPPACDLSPLAMEKGAEIAARAEDAATRAAEDTRDKWVKMARARRT